MSKRKPVNFFSPADSHSRQIIKLTSSSFSFLSVTGVTTKKPFFPQKKRKSRSFGSGPNFLLPFFLFLSQYPNPYVAIAAASGRAPKPRPKATPIATPQPSPPLLLLLLLLLPCQRHARPLIFPTEKRKREEGRRRSLFEKAEREGPGQKRHRIVIVVGVAKLFVVFSHSVFIFYTP